MDYGDRRLNDVFIRNLLNQISREKFEREPGLDLGPPDR